MDYESSKAFAETLRTTGRDVTQLNKSRTLAPHAPSTASQDRLDKTTPMITQERPRQVPALRVPPTSDMFTARPDFATQINQMKTMTNRVSLSGAAFSHTHPYTFTNSSSIAATGPTSERRRTICGKTNRPTQWVAARELASIVPTAGSPEAYRDPRGVNNNPLVGSHALDTWHTYLANKNDANEQDVTTLSASSSATLDQDHTSTSTTTETGAETSPRQSKTHPDPSSSLDALAIPAPRPRTLRKIVDMPWCGNTPISATLYQQNGQSKLKNSPAWWPQQTNSTHADSLGSVSKDEPTEADYAAVRKATAALAKELGDLNTRSWFRSVLPPASCASTPCTMTLPQFLETIPQLGLNLTPTQTNLLTSMLFSRKQSKGVDQADQADDASVTAKPLEFNHLVSRIRTDAGYVPHVTKYAAMMANVREVTQRNPHWPKYSHEQAIDLLRDHLLPRRASEAAALGLGQHTSYQQIEHALSILNIRLGDGELTKLCAKLDTDQKGYVNITDVLLSDPASTSRSRLTARSRASSADSHLSGSTESEFARQRAAIDPASRYRLQHVPEKSSTEISERKLFASKADERVRNQTESVWQPGPVATRYGRTYAGRLNSARVITPGLDNEAAHLVYAKAGQIGSETGAHMDVSAVSDRYKPRDQAIAEMQAEDRARRQDRRDRIVRAKQSHENEIASRCEDHMHLAAARSEGRRLGLIATRLQFCDALEQRTSYSTSLDT